jgi:hypothetical protein
MCCKNGMLLDQEDISYELIRVVCDMLQNFIIPWNISFTFGNQNLIPAVARCTWYKFVIKYVSVSFILACLSDFIEINSILKSFNPHLNFFCEKLDFLTSKMTLSASHWHTLSQSCIKYILHQQGLNSDCQR